MEFVVKDLITKCWWSWGFLIVAVISAAVLGSGMWHGNLTAIEKGWLGVLVYGSIAGFFVKPIWTAATSGHSHLLTVCIWSLFLVALFVPFSFFVFYSFFGHDPTRYDKVLNVLPVLVAAWAAGLGWLVHFRLSTKAHRTNNSFSILMETRKSAEYLRRAELFTKHFPPGMASIPQAYFQYFPADSIFRLHQAGPAPNAAQLEMAEAVQAMKYLLNYYEFMAVAISAGDLDEKLLYDTIGPPVVKMFNRSRNYVDYVSLNAPDKQKLTYIVLRKLVAKWEPQIQIDSANAQIP
ncbi:DUF4760 domain-containing protein [Pseudoxanthomonas sp. LARHCG66]